ncbi:MAG: DNA-directed RNA polymerase beta' subunit [uncultured Thermomicrobiales bacterium]|uniref:DNA-directed RNA polymerase subunit beta' n=1 Tax=uncultured Thermomicrobiales bacterium TaxID=1645740 RepID=A0A6J4V2K1_9BACT|nr:MAG: DNA-directed RNA polymerase beta' subunit [uncultured Thermomicrobiales bacterium]
MSTTIDTFGDRGLPTLPQRDQFGSRPAGGFGAMTGGQGGYSRADRQDRSRVLDVNNFDAIRISLASPEAIRGWSYGEVTKPETINYRTLKPEHGGLFCERIFGPTRDWECYCGKYKRIRHAGTVCDKCGVEVTRSKVRRERMGHIELAAPVTHIWYVKGTPSRLGLLLDITPRNLERILYFASYLVTDVDQEAKQQAVEDINEEHDATVEEIRSEADHELRQIDERLGLDVGNLAEGARNLTASIQERQQAELAVLRADYDALVSELQGLLGEAAPRTLSLGGRLIVEEDAAVNQDRLDAVEEAFAAERERIEGGAGHEATGTAALTGAETDQLTFDAEQRKKKITDALAEAIKAEEKQRDELLKQLNDLKELQILTETQYRELNEVVPPGVFKAGMGAEAVYDYVSKKVDLDQLALTLRTEMQAASDVKRKKATKRLRVVEALRKSGNKPSWMIFTALPVIPPELRPMVQLDGGRFATSDLNDLYRRVINRNNRLKRLLELGAPDIIVRNEKRMLQEAVDALIDNGRRGRVVSGSGKHKLKSLSDMLKGKQGRFRQNLLGKRVDYSGRSVIVVGPDLALDECGVPKRMALELFKPFVMRRLVDEGHAHNIKAAKRLVERVDPRVWDVLEGVIKDYVVLLNRAPTLHRLGIQAFRVRLIEGSAIQIHPLVCTAFNADFDGDQMAVHVPLSRAAQDEARSRMLSVNNLLSPSNGDPIVSPTQDIVLGCYYMTSLRDFEEDRVRGTVPRGWGKVFASMEEVRVAYECGAVDLQAQITVHTDRYGDRRKLETTVGRVLFNLALPPAIGQFYDKTMSRKELRRVVADAYRLFQDPGETARIVNEIKKVGFEFSTRGGMSIAVADVTMSETKTELLEKADAEAEKLERQFRRGLVTEDERLRELEVIWNGARDELARDVENRLRGQNSVFMMVDGGAKGNMNQISQMAGMRGLVLDPEGRIIDIPIRSNYREGLTVLEYFLSTHGARKGLADTALRTADSGYLTRRLCDVAQDVMITIDDCGTEQGLWTQREDSAGKPVSDEEFRARITGRIMASDVVHPETGEILIARGEELTDRLPLDGGGQRDLVGEVLASGVEKLHLRSVMVCEATHGVCQTCYGRDLASGEQVERGEAVGIIAAQSIGEPGTQLTMRTFHTGGVARADITTGLPRVEELFEARVPKGAAILAEKEGVVSIEQTDTGRLLVITSTEQDSRTYRLEQGWEPALAPGAMVLKDKTVLATGPDDAKLYSEIEGTFLLDGRTIYVRNEREDREEHQVPIAFQILVEDGATVAPGQQLTDGAKDPQQILLTLGRDEVQRYLVEEVQKVYRSQGVNTNDKHIEVMCRQMLRKVSIVHPGDTDYLPEERIDRFEFNQINEEILAQGGEPATAMPVLLGITKASLETDSFLSAASFQETTRVLTEAAINGKVDNLRGLKENVIIGKLIPAGSGFGVVPSEPLGPLDEANLAAMEGGSVVAVASGEPASDEDYTELMAGGLIPGGVAGASAADAGEESMYSLIGSDDLGSDGAAPAPTGDEE